MKLNNIPESRYNIEYNKQRNTLSFILAGATKPNKDNVDRQKIYAALLETLREGRKGGLVQFTEEGGELYGFNEQIFSISFIKEDGRVCVMGKPVGDLGKLFLKKLAIEGLKEFDLGTVSTHAGLDTFVFEQFMALFPAAQKKAAWLNSICPNAWGNSTVINITYAITPDEVRIDKKTAEESIYPVPYQIESNEDFMRYVMSQAAACYLIEYLSRANP